MTDAAELALLALAALAAGAVNAIAGGGTLISFPALTALGVPALVANVTNTVALCPGYLGATLAQAADLRGQRTRLWLLLPAAVAGGVGGALLVLHTGEKAFRELVPFLILFASGLLAVQERVRTAIARRRTDGTPPHAPARLAVVPVAFAAVYGGYFGAGLSVIVLAVLGMLLDDTLVRLNALKQALALAVNVAAAVVFVMSGTVVWTAAFVMAIAALVGGAIGGRVAARLPASVLRWTIVVAGVIVALIYLMR